MLTLEQTNRWIALSQRLRGKLVKCGYKNTKNYYGHGGGNYTWDIRREDDGRYTVTLREEYFYGGYNHIIREANYKTVKECEKYARSI